MASFSGTLLRALTLHTLRIFISVYIKKLGTMQTCSGWTEHPSCSMTPVLPAVAKEQTKWVELFKRVLSHQHLRVC